MRRSTGTLSLALGALLALAAAPPVGAQEPHVDDAVCLLTLEEMSAIVGATFVARAAAGDECAYATDPAVDLLSVWLQVIPTEPVEAGGPDALHFFRFDHEAGGRDTTVAGLPAWVSDDGIWVDTGRNVLGVWPLFLFDDDPPPVPHVVTAIAEMAVPRSLALPAASPAAVSSRTATGRATS